MARIIVPLTDAGCRKAQYSPVGSNKIFDGGGLYLEIRATGLKVWRFRYKQPHNKKESVITLGNYPELTLAEARLKRAELYKQVADGLDPVIERKLAIELKTQEAENTFSTLADEWLEFRKKEWSDAHYRRMKNALKNNAYASIGNLPMNRITGKLVLDIIHVVESRGALEMASRVLDGISMVFRYAVATGRARSDVTYGLDQFLAEKPPVKHFPHVSEDELPRLLALMERYSGRIETVKALYLMVRTFPRTGELRFARWEEFNLDDQVWLIPSARMKGRKMQKLHGLDHVIPLSNQVVKMLRDLKSINGRFPFLFPGVKNPRTSPISADTMNKALSTIGFDKEQTGHGFRGLFSTILHERTTFTKDVIKAQMSHKEKDLVEAAYNHAKYLDERRELMQWWSDYLDVRRSEVGPDGTRLDQPAIPIRQIHARLRMLKTA